MPRKQNGFGNSKSLAFKPSKSVSKSKAKGVLLVSIQVTGSTAPLCIEV